MIKNYTHNVIRLRKGKPSVNQVYWVIVILNKKKTSSQKQVEQLGFFMHGEEKLFCLNYSRLAFYLNKGFKLKKSIKKFIYWNSDLTETDLTEIDLEETDLVESKYQYISESKYQYISESKYQYISESEITDSASESASEESDTSDYEPEDPEYTEYTEDTVIEK